MKSYSKLEVQVRGYDSGVTLAIWFPIIPEHIPVPHQCSEYSSEYTEAVIRGYRDHRKHLNSVANGE